MKKFLKYLWKNKEKRNLMLVWASFSLIGYFVGASNGFVLETAIVALFMLIVIIYGSWQNFKGRQA